MGRVVIFSNLSRDLPGWDKFIQMILDAGHEIFDPGEKDLSDKEAIRHLIDTDAVFVGLNKFSGTAIRAGKLLKVIAKTGVGVDNIDVVAATEEGIMVCNTPGSNTQAVADHLFGLILSVTRQLPYLDRITRDGRGWEKYPPVMGIEIYGKTLGVIGTGQIGKAVIQRAKGFAMEIVAYDAVEDPELVKDYSVRYLPLKDVLKGADLITLHLPLSEKTRGLIGEDEIRTMKRTAYLFNASRGPIVDEKALIRALRERQIAGAGLDVFEEEPLVQSELFELENVVLTPHMAGYSPEASIRARIMSAENIINALRGVEPRLVNREVLGLPQMRVQLNNRMGLHPQ